MLTHPNHRFGESFIVHVRVFVYMTVVRPQHDFRAGVFSEFGWLNTDCPGNACGLNPSLDAEYDMKKPCHGYKFSCHNVDTAAQQLTLLAGVAALHDKARQEIKS